MLLLFVLMGAGLAVSQSLGWVTWFFPLSTREVVELSFLYLSAHAILCFAGPLQVLCQYQNRARALVKALGASVLLSWICQLVFSPRSYEMALLIALLLFAMLISTASLFISKPTSKHR
jgi:O-antigen/teichoic acid export membrane protein